MLEGISQNHAKRVEALCIDRNIDKTGIQNKIKDVINTSINQTSKSSIQTDNRVNTTLPKLVHFIWEGKELPQKFLKNVLRVNEVNPEHEVIIWSSKKELILNALDKMLRPNDCSHQDLHHLPFSIRNPVELFNEVSAQEFPDINGLFSAWLRENNGSYACFQASSDILRLFVLQKFGGCYLDMDMFLKKALPTTLKPTASSMFTLHKFSLSNKVHVNQNGLMLAKKGSMDMTTFMRSVARFYRQGETELYNPIKMGRYNPIKIGRYNLNSHDELWTFKREVPLITCYVSGPQMMGEVLASVEKHGCEDLHENIDEMATFQCDFGIDNKLPTRRSSTSAILDNLSEP